MLVGEIYKHENCTDAAIEVQYLRHLENGNVKVFVTWLNVVNPENIFPTGEAEVIEIKREDIPKWKELK